MRYNVSITAVLFRLRDKDIRSNVRVACKTTGNLVKFYCQIVQHADVDTEIKIFLEDDMVKCVD